MLSMVRLIPAGIALRPSFPHKRESMGDEGSLCLDNASKPTAKTQRRIGYSKQSGSLWRAPTCAVFAAALLAGCAVGPDYIKPEMAVPAAYKEGWKPAEPNDVQARGPWWQMFQDAVLNDLEQQLSQPAGLGNQNLRLYEARYRQAEALGRAARSSLWPSLNANAATTRAGSRNGGVSNDHSLSLAATWEVDVWGRIRRTVEADDAGTQASAADLAAALLSAQASLAQDYFLLRAADRQKELLEESVAAYEKSLQLTQNRFQGGIASQADVAQAQTQLLSTRASLLDVGVQRAQLEHAIAVLLGQAPAEFKLPPAPLPTAIPLPSAGLPSALLERRPDVAAAERRVAAANAQIGVAKAAFFPSLSLNAGGGYESASFARWISEPSRYWSIGPSLALSLFDAGLHRANSDQAVAAYDATVASYRQTVLGAMQEVEDNLAALRILAEEAKVLEQAVAAGRRSLTIANNQYKEGIVTYLNVVSAQTTALGLERNAAGVQANRLTAAVLLAKALGGGWTGLPTSVANAQP